MLTLSAKVVERCELILIEGQKLREVLNQHGDLGHLVMVNVAKLLADHLMQTKEAFVYERNCSLVRNEVPKALSHKTQEVKSL